MIILGSNIFCNFFTSFQVAVTDMRYFAIFFFGSLVQKKKVESNNCYRQICKQVIVKLLLAYSFWKMFFIGQNLKDVHMTNSHDLLLIKSSKYLLFGVYFSLHQRNNVCKYERQRKPIVKEIQIDLFFSINSHFAKVWTSNV